MDIKECLNKYNDIQKQITDIGRSLWLRYQKKRNKHPRRKNKYNIFLG